MDTPSTPTERAGGVRGLQEAMHQQQPLLPGATGGGQDGWAQITQNLAEFQTTMQDMQRPITHDETGAPVPQHPDLNVNDFPQHYYATNADISALYGGQAPTPGFFDQIQYLPMNANFYMPPGAGLPYMDPYGLMNPAALPPLTAPMVPKKATPKKERSRCC